MSVLAWRGVLPSARVRTCARALTARAFQALEWISRTSISCKVPAGVGTPQVSVAVGETGDGGWQGQCTRCGVFVSMSGAFSYDRPTVAKATQPPEGYRPALGGFPVTVTGTGFGTYDSGQVVGVVSSFYGGDALSASTIWTSDSSIIVSAPPGVGAGRQVNVQVAGQMSAADGKANIDYDAPYVRRARPALAPKEGGRRVTVFGLGFGPAPPPDSSSNSGETVGSPPNVIVDQDTSVSSATNRSNSTSASGAPSQSALANQTSGQSDEQGRRAPNEGGSQLSSAAGGKLQSTKGMMAKIADTECMQTEWISQTAAACVTPPGEGAFLPVRLMVGEQWSAEPDLSDLWHAPTFSFVGASIKVTALLSRSVEQYERMGGHDQYSAAIAARLLTECITFYPEACGSAFRKSQVMFTAEPMSYAQWCSERSGCVLPELSDPNDQDDQTRRSGHGTGSEYHLEDPLLHLLRRRSIISHSEFIGRRSAGGRGGRAISEGGNVEAASNETAEADSLEESTVVEFKLLGSETSPDSHTGALALLYRMGIDGYLWALGIRAVKLEGKEWEIAQRDCPRGDRYNDLQCEGRGRCVSGACLCDHMYSGERCQIRGSFTNDELLLFSIWTRGIAACILGLSALAHFLAWVVAGGFFCKQVLVSGDYWSFLLHLQFIALTSFLDTSLPNQYFEWASYYRVFTLQFDPKDVVEAWGFDWKDIMPVPLTNFCYKEALPEFHPRADLMGKLGGGNASAISLDTLAELGLDTSLTEDGGGHRRFIFMGQENVEGMGGKVGHDKARGALEVSFRLLTSSLVCCYGILILVYLSRCAFAKMSVNLRLRNHRAKKLRTLQEIEEEERKKMNMSAEEVAEYERKQAEEASRQAAADLAAESECHNMSAHEALRHAHTLKTQRSTALSGKIDVRLDQASMDLKEIVEEEEEEAPGTKLKIASLDVVGQDFGYRIRNAEELELDGRMARQSLEDDVAADALRCEQEDGEDVQKEEQKLEDWQRWICAEEDWWEAEKYGMRQLVHFERLTRAVSDADIPADAGDGPSNSDSYAHAALHSASLSESPSEAFLADQTGSGARFEYSTGQSVHVHITGANLGGGTKEQSSVEHQEQGAGRANGAEPEAEADKLVGDGSDLKCALCKEQGHCYKDCDQLSAYLEEQRSVTELVSADLSFPRWEIPIMSFIIAGVSSSTGAVLAAAGPAGCPVMYVSVIALIPIVAFQIFIFLQVEKQVYSKTENKVWWRRNNLQEARMDRHALMGSNWPRSRTKSRMDYLDALSTTGWWEEAVKLSVRTVIDEDGQKRVIKGGGWLSEEQCNAATNIVCREAALVPALFLRSREGMEAAASAGELKHFLLKAKDKLTSVVKHVADIELRKLGIKEPAIVQNWTSNACESLWPCNEDCYRRAIYEGERPDCVLVSDPVKEHLASALGKIKGMAETEYSDPEGKFLLRYRSIYKRLAGNTSWQVHYLSIQMAIRFLTALSVGLFSGPLQGVIVVCLNAVNVAIVAGIIPFKNRLQNFKHLFQCTCRTFLLLLALMMVPHGSDFETNEAANAGTFIVVLLLGAAIDALSPMFGSLRSLLGSMTVCCGLHRRNVVMGHQKISAFVKYCIGQQRNRTSLYLKPDGLKRAYKTWDELRTRKRSSKLLKSSKKLEAQVCLRLRLPATYVCRHVP